MKTLTLAMILLAGSTAYAGAEPRGSEVERLRAMADYYARAGKPNSAEPTRQVADAKARSGAPRTIYVPTIRSERLSRDESLRLTEAVGKAIERETRFKVVGSPDEADLILDATPRPAVRAWP